MMDFSRDGLILKIRCRKIENIQIPLDYQLLLVDLFPHTVWAFFYVNVENPF